MKKTGRRIQWLCFFRRANLSLFLTSQVFPGYARRHLKRWKISGIGFEHIKSDQSGNVYFERNEWNRNGRRFLRFIVDQPAVAQRLIRTSRCEGDAFLAFAHKYAVRRWERATARQLARAVRELRSRCLSWGLWMVWPQTVDTFLEAHIRARLIRPRLKISTDEDEALGALIKPNQPIFAEQEQRDLARIAIQMRHKLSKRRLRKILERHVRQYGWIPARWWHGAGWTVPDALKRARAFTRPEAFLITGAKHAREQARITEHWRTALKLDNLEQALVSLTRELVWLRTYRTDILNWVGFRLRQFFHAVAARLGVTYGDLLQLHADEVIASLEQKMPRPELGAVLERRKKEAWWFIINGKRQNVKYAKAAQSSAPGKVGLMRGKTAYPGRVVGMARVIHGSGQFKKVNKGDVVIATMTSPDFVPVLQRASAIVTDEGGVTCHAAIVAREMKKPCVIGTKIATKVFKDGDRVEVDANKGVVRKI